MDLQANEITEVKNMGELNGEPLKVLRTTGGFYIAVGKRKRQDRAVDTLAAGSHPAIVMHHISTKFPTFEKSIDKSETEAEYQTEDCSKKLPHYLRDQGFEIFAISKNENIEIVATNRNVEIAKINIEDGKVSSTFATKNQDIKDSLIQVVEQYFKWKT